MILLNTSCRSGLSSSSHSFNTLLLFRSAQIDFPWYYILQTYSCHWIVGCALCNTNTGCYHNGPVPSQVTNSTACVQLVITDGLHVCACTTRLFGLCCDNQLAHSTNKTLTVLILMPRCIQFHSQILCVRHACTKCKQIAHFVADDVSHKLSPLLYWHIT